MISLLLEQVTDQYIRENFQKVREFTRGFPFQGFRHVQISIPAAVQNFKYKHNLGFVPKDVVQTSLQGSGGITFNYGQFDREFLDLSTTGPCEFRGYIGTHQEI